MFIYLDNILCVYHDPDNPLVKLDEYLKMKEGYIQVQTFYSDKWNGCLMHDLQQVCPV
jgi:hypothetical protein